jgi:Zn-dependent protease with chaperone function
MTVSARFYDGDSAAAHDADVSHDGRDLTIATGAETHVWPARDLSVDIHGGQARVSRRRSDVRLVLAEADWNRLTAAHPSVRTHNAGGGRGLIIGLVTVAAGLALFVFVGMPALSGPLARATPIDYERRMGDSYNAQISALFPTCENEPGQAVLSELGARIAAQADSPFEIRVRAVHAPMVNAFALPGGYVLVTGDLIAEAESPDELAAVLAHEVAHVERRHVMQGVWRSLGAGILLDLVVGGGTGAGQQAVLLAGQASELSFGREAEREADAVGQGYLHAAGLSSRGMAPLFERMAEQEGQTSEDVDEVAEWWMTHPNTARRIQAARAAERDGAGALSATQWETLRGVCILDEGEGGGRPWFDRIPVRRPGNDPLPGKPDQVSQD